MTAIDGWWKRSSKNSGMAEFTRPEVRVRVLGIEGLALTKLGMRDKDRADLQVLREAIATLKR